MSRVAIVAGGTGLIGSHCLRRLSLEPSYTQTIALVRKPSGLQNAKVVERIVNFNKLGTLDLPQGADVFCALGTTIRVAGSNAAFQKVDLDYVIGLARRSAAQGARQFLVVSSVGADKVSSNFYLRTKGEMEMALSEIRFHGTHVFRPSVLIGNRNESRPAERAGIVAARALRFLLIGPLRKYRAIRADTVAAAMVAAALLERPGIHRFHFDDIERLANRNQKPSHT